jgi:hypothetical protein
LKQKFIIQSQCILQKVLNTLKYKKGDFPVTDAHTKKIITFPCDQHLSKKQLNYIIKTVKNFYKFHEIKYVDLSSFSGKKSENFFCPELSKVFKKC